MTLGSVNLDTSEGVRSLCPVQSISQIGLTGFTFHLSLHFPFVFQVKGQITVEKARSHWVEVLVPCLQRPDEGTVQSWFYEKGSDTLPGCKIIQTPLFLSSGSGNSSDTKQGKR